MLREGGRRLPSLAAFEDDDWKSGDEGRVVEGIIVLSGVESILLRRECASQCTHLELGSLPILIGAHCPAPVSKRCCMVLGGYGVGIGYDRAAGEKKTPQEREGGGPRTGLKRMLRLRSDAFARLHGQRIEWCGLVIDTHNKLYLLDFQAAIIIIIIIIITSFKPSSNPQILNADRIRGSNSGPAG